MISLLDCLYLYFYCILKHVLKLTVMHLGSQVGVVVIIGAFHLSNPRLIPLALHMD